MDLFTYLMAKKGHNTSVHGDLYAYLLGKNNSTLKVESGTTLEITAKKTKINKLILDKESTQKTTIGKNLFDKDNANVLNGFFNAGTITSSENAKIVYISCEANTIYTMSKVESARFQLAYSNSTPSVNGSVLGTIANNSATSITITTGSEAQYLVAYIYSSSDTLTLQEILNSIQIEEGSTATDYEPYTGGIPSPNPDYPQKVKTVKGYRNLFDKDNANIINCYINAQSSSENYKKILVNDNARLLYIACKSNTTYTITRIAGQRFVVGSCVNTPAINVICTNEVHDSTGTTLTITTGSNDIYLAVFYYVSNADTLTEQEILNSIMIVEGINVLPYVPYGNNYINVNITNGTDTKNISIPLNDNELVGIGTYKDELYVDKTGHCWLNKKCGKAILKGSENFSYVNGVFYKNNFIDFKTDENPLSNYFTYGGTCNNTSTAYNNGNNKLSFNSSDNSSIYLRNDNLTNATEWNNWLSNHNTLIYYALATPQLIDLETTIDISLYKGSNTITNSEDANMTLYYY